MRTIYQCELCDEIYLTETLARGCEEQRPKDMGWAVGDVVAGAFGATWCDGNPKWVVNPEVLEWLHFNKALDYRSRKKVSPWHPRDQGAPGRCRNGPCCTIGFYYVVTEVQPVRHESRYYLFTEATLFPGYRSGWIDKRRAQRAGLIKPPFSPRLVRESSYEYVSMETDNRELQVYM